VILNPIKTHLSDILPYYHHIASKVKSQEIKKNINKRKKF